jgi:hypothetical protein
VLFDINTAHNKLTGMVNMPLYETDVILQFEITGGAKHELVFVVRGDSLLEIKNKAKELYHDIIDNLPEQKSERPPGIGNQSIKLGGERGLELHKGQ